MTLVMSDIEYGVRWREHGAIVDQITPVGSVADATELIEELRNRQGITGKRVDRQVGPWEAS